jgi:hypothetical protein
MYSLHDSLRPDKKFMIITPSGKKVHFGAVGYESFTTHKDEARKERYIIRHKKRENWTKTGTATPGFWSRWLLWNKPTIRKSIIDIQNRFGITIHFDSKHK